MNPDTTNDSSDDRSSMDSKETTKLVNDEVELTSVQEREVSYPDVDHSAEVVMRENSVQPVVAPNTVGVASHAPFSIADKTDGFDALSPEALAPLVSTNQYTVRKMAASALMDVALMMANISQLRTLITAGAENTDYFYALVVLVALSLICQLLFAILIFVIWVRESDQQQKEEYINTLRQVPNFTAGDVEDPDRVRAERMRMSLVVRQETLKDSRLTNHLNYATTVIVFAITVINMFITGFGIKLE